jgi:3-methyladenine DNA glycosylase AlkC
MRAIIICRRGAVMKDYIAYLAKLIPEKDSLKLVRAEAEKYYKTHTLEECYNMGLGLYYSDNFQIQEVGVFLLGYSAHEYKKALPFFKDIVSQHESWKVQEILAMAFDNHCKIIGYETALPLIKEWLGSECANVRRAVSEGLRIWTSRPYFKEYPQIAIDLLSAHKRDESEYVRKSVGNALRDISKKYPELVFAELSTWSLTSKEIKQVHRLASKFINNHL